MIISANKFKNLKTGSIYVITGYDYAMAFRISKSICKPKYRQFIGALIQVDSNSEVAHKFFEGVDVVIRGEDR